MQPQSHSQAPGCNEPWLHGTHLPSASEEPSSHPLGKPHILPVIILPRRQCLHSRLTALFRQSASLIIPRRLPSLRAEVHHVIPSIPTNRLTATRSAKVLIPINSQPLVTPQTTRL